MMGVVEPGSHDPLGAPGIWANETDLKGEIDWLDDSVSGLCCRKIYEPKDVIGSKGEIAGVPYIFDAILQTGQNVIVYQLTNLDTCDYLAYGFGRTDFDARHALVQYLRHIVEGKRPYISGKIIALANWVSQKLSLLMGLRFSTKVWRIYMTRTFPKHIDVLDCWFRKTLNIHLPWCTMRLHWREWANMPKQSSNYAERTEFQKKNSETTSDRLDRFAVF